MRSPPTPPEGGFRPLARGILSQTLSNSTLAEAWSSTLYRSSSPPCAEARRSLAGRFGTASPVLRARAATMLFNTLTFAIFFAVTYALYVNMRHRAQNVLLLIASYVFYGWWDWRFLFLLAASTLLDYFCALGIQHADRPSARQRYLVVSLCGNLGMLGFFKYFGWFAHSLQELAAGFGWHMDAFTLQVVLPVGISFYTFQTMSYVIDVYRRQVPATRDLLDFALSVAFFPHL